jgi:hypothetical protein
MSRQFKLYGLPAILAAVCLFIGWPLLLGVSPPLWLQPLQVAFIPASLLLGGVVLAIPAAYLLTGLVGLIIGRR